MEGEVKKRRRKDQMVNLIVVSLLQSAAASLITAELFEVRGQRVCRLDRGRPCYKLAYFSDPGRRLSFLEARLACRRDGGELLSVESPAEQRIIEQLVTELRPSDGDFWIGLRRNHGDTENVDDCPSQYYWTDGSLASFRNWHWDEPSCGYEVCVVMYHQPSAPPGLGGLYMFHWNDDNCDTKNNFICKYTAEKAPEPSPNTAHPEAPPLSLSPLTTTFDTEEKRHTPALNIVYIVLPIIPLLMVLLIATAVFCFTLLARRRKQREQQTEVCPSDPGSCPNPAQPPDVYNVIRSQQEADLAGTRPHTKNTSFLGSSPDMSPGDYDNLGGLRDTESGFVTLASTESNFQLTSELYDLSLGRRKDDSDIYHNSLGRNGEVYNNSLGRHGNREVYNNSLGRHGNGETHDNSLGCHGNGGTYNNRLGLHGRVVKSSELYNTSHYRDGLYQTSLDRYGNPEQQERSLGRHGNDASVDCYGKEATVGYYGNEGSLGGKCYKEWLDSDSN